MKASSFAKGAAMLATLALVVPAATATAQTKAEAKCRATISKAVGKYIATAEKAIIGCHKSRNKGKVGASTNCNDLVVADTKGKLVKAAAKVSGGIAKKCFDKKTGVPMTAVLDLFGRCPTPAETADDGGATTGIDDFGELGDCLIALSRSLVETTGKDILGLPGSLDKGQAKCHATLAKNYTKLINTIVKVRSGCEKGADKVGTGLGYSCGGPGADAKGKIQKTADKTNAAIDKACALGSKASVNPVDSCGDTTAQLKSCITDTIATKAGNGMSAMVYELPGNCPAKASVFINAANGAQLTTTQLDVGFTGLGHDVDVLDGFKGSVNLACDPDCDNCTVTIDTMKTDPAGNCRCANDPTVHCDVINGNDADDCGGNLCECFFGAPLALSAGGSPVCVQNKIVSELDGTADTGTGSSDTVVTMASVLWLGISQAQPCPTCDGDATANDGNAGGTCNGGTRDGLACDQNGDHPTFGPSSYDCPPTGSNVSGTGLQITLDLTDAPVSLGFDTPCDFPQQASSCACAVCSGDTSLPCNSDAECTTVGAGTCNTNGGGAAAARAPNQCADGVCSDTGDGLEGTCNGGPSDSFCSDVLRASGEGFIPCSSDGDCAVSALGFDAGTCTASKQRPCFLDPIVASGSPSPNGADLVSVFCTPPSTSSAVNLAGGSPGPGRVQLNFDFDGLCSDGLTSYEAPGGSNCP